MDGTLDALCAITGERDDSALATAPADYVDAGDTSSTPVCPALSFTRSTCRHIFRRCTSLLLCLQCADVITPGVAVRQASELSYADFVVRYMAPNVPVIIQVIQQFVAAALRACQSGSSWQPSHVEKGGGGCRPDRIAPDPAISTTWNSDARWLSCRTEGCTPPPAVGRDQWVGSAA